MLVEKTNPEDMTDAQIDDLKAGKGEADEQCSDSCSQRCMSRAQGAAGAAGAGPDMGSGGRRQHSRLSAVMMMWLTETTERSK